MGLIKCAPAKTTAPTPTHHPTLSFPLALHQANPNTPRKKNSSNTATRIAAPPAPNHTPHPGTPPHFRTPSPLCPNATNPNIPIPTPAHIPARNTCPFHPVRSKNFLGSSLQYNSSPGTSAKATPS